MSARAYTREQEEDRPMTTETSPETTTDTATISSKSRNLGYAWSNTYKSTSRGWEQFPLDAPDVQGGLRAIEAERVHAHQINSGGQNWYEGLFVGGRRVSAVWDFWCEWPETEYDDEGRATNYGTEPTRSGYGWMGYTVSDVLYRLRKGETLKVRLA